MSDNELRTVRIALICVCVFLTSCVVSCNADNAIRRVIYADTLNKATAAGKDPMIVGCAWGFSSTGEAAVCAQAVSKP